MLTQQLLKHSEPMHDTSDIDTELFEYRGSRNGVDYYNRLTNWELEILEISPDSENLGLFVINHCGGDVYYVQNWMTELVPCTQRICQTCEDHDTGLSLYDKPKLKHGKAVGS